MKHVILFAVIIQLTSFVYAQNQEIIISEVTGTVEYQTPGSANWINARVGDRLEQASIISTSFKSSARISVGSSSILVRPLTRLSLEAIIDQDKNENIDLALRAGRVRVDVKPPSGSRADFTIQTPSSVASVRGTTFEIDPYNINVISGTVRYEPSGKASFQPVLVNADQSSWIDSGTGKAQNPIAAAEANRSLPSLPGQAAVPDTVRVASSEGSPGSLELVINPE